ncbi:UNVERIFIED_ORG: hypothetical protein J2Y78_003964 [Buttiauxella agrestis ATCC 33320]
MDKLYKLFFSFFTLVYLCSLTIDGVVIRQILTVLFFIISLCVFLTYRVKFSAAHIAYIVLLVILFSLMSVFSPNPDWKLKILFIFSGVAFLAVSYALYIINYNKYFLHFFIFIVGIISIRLFFNQNENLIFFQASRNIVATYIIFPVIACFFVTRQKSFFMFLALISLFMCFLLKGRTAIILSSILVCVAIYRCYGLKVLLLTGLCFAPLVLIINIGMIFEKFTANTNFSEGLETTRSIIYAEYFSDFNLQDFFIGRNFDSMPIITLLNNNPHNSFILIHSLFGITPVLFLMAFFTYSILVIKTLHGPLYAIVLALVPIKAMTDSVLFFNILDIFYMLPIIMMLANEKYKIISNNNVM